MAYVIECFRIDFSIRVRNKSTHENGSYVVRQCYVTRYFLICHNIFLIPIDIGHISKYFVILIS